MADNNSVETISTIDPTTALICLTVFGVTALAGIFATKTQGFGKYTTSLLLLVLVLFLSSFFFVLGSITSTMFVNIVFAVTGFGGGLLSAKKIDEQ
jgi:ABC-type multidrug transport system permease subunit